MRYFLMNESYDFVEVDEADYNSPPSNMIPNRITFDKGFISAELDNVDLSDLAQFFSLIGQSLIPSF